MKKVIKVIIILLFILSLGLNALLLYDKKNSKIDNCEVTDINTNKKDIKITKENFSKLFKAYQVDSKLANADNMALFDVTKVTEVGYFKTGNRKLYYVDEKYSCIEGTECLSTIGKVSTDESYISTTTFVVAAEIVDENTIVFEILDYGIEENEDFVKISHKELK